MLRQQIERYRNAPLRLFCLTARAVHVKALNNPLPSAVDRYSVPFAYLDQVTVHRGSAVILSSFHASLIRCALCYHHLLSQEDQLDSTRLEADLSEFHADSTALDTVFWIADKLASTRQFRLHIRFLKAMTSSMTME
jgi:hypothetical protein